MPDASQVESGWAMWSQPKMTMPNKSFESANSSILDIYSLCASQRLQVTVTACSHRQHGQDKTVLSCPRLRCEDNWWQDKTVLFCLDPILTSFVLSRPSFQFTTVQSQIHWGLLKTWKLETRSRQEKTVLSCLQLCSRQRHGQDETILSCPCRRCEQAIRISTL